MRPILATVIGTDGSGKTTVSDRVASRLSDDGVAADRVWLGAESMLMRPIRMMLRPLWKRRAKRRGPSDTRGGYMGELSGKRALSAKYAWAVRLYVGLVMADYKIQLAAKLRRARRRDVVVADRYVFDVAVNLGLTLGWSPARVVRFLRHRLSEVALPAVRIFLRVEPHVSMSRKDDIPDADYLVTRFQYYEAIAAAFGFTTLDGTQPVDDNAEIVYRQIVAAGRQKYIYYVHSNNVDVGGADKVLASMATQMRDFERDSHAPFRVNVSLRLNTSIVSRYEDAGIPVTVHDFVRPQLSLGLGSVAALALRAPGTIWRFIRIFKREQPDVVHVNDLYDFLPAIAARILGIPVVYHIRMIRTNRLLRVTFAQLIKRLCSFSISVSEAVKRHYFGRRPWPRARVVHDHANPELMSDQGDVTEPGPWPVGLPVGERLVLMVGRLEPWKGQHIFVEAVDQLDPSIKDGVVFAIAGGEVPGRERYASKVRSLADRAGVVMLGARDDVPALLRAADVNVHCSVDPDPFPGVVLESMLAGAATIGSAAGGVLEMLERPELGILVPPGQPDALSAALASLLKGGPPRERYGSPARSQALRLVEPTILNEALADIYFEASASRPGALGSEKVMPRARSGGRA